MSICMTAARRATGMSRPRFAAAVGVRPSTVQRWERGERIPTEARVEAVEHLLTRVGVDLRAMEGAHG